MYGNYIISDDEKIKGTFSFDQTGVHTSGLCNRRGKQHPVSDRCNKRD